MIEKTLLGKTPYGGKIFYLSSDKAYEIPAIRIFVSTQRPIKALVKEPISSTEDLIEYINKHPEIAKPYVKKILKFFHGDIGEMGRDALYFKSVSRLFTFESWVPVGATRGIKGVGTELSLRYVKAKDFIDLKNEKIKRINEESTKLYQELREDKVPKEDARYVLPLTAKTEEIIQIQLGRDLAKWASYLKKRPFKEAKAAGETILSWNEAENGFFSPQEEIPDSKIPLFKKDESLERKSKEKFLKKIHYNPLTQSLIWFSNRSISSFHQDVRNRQVYFWWPSWESALEDEEFYFPLTLPEEKREKFKEHCISLLEVSRKFWKKKEFELAVISLPLAKRLKVFSAIYGNRNIYETIRLRTCLRAQLEIRSQYQLIASLIKKDFPGELGPRCQTEGICFEPFKEKCPLYSRYVRKTNN